MGNQPAVSVRPVACLHRKQTDLGQFENRRRLAADECDRARLDFAPRRAGRLGADRQRRERKVFFLSRRRAPQRAAENFRDTNSDELLFRSQLEDLATDKPPAIRSLWLVDIQADGKIAFRPLPSLTLDRNPKKILAHTPAVFSPGDFNSGNLGQLKAALQTALVADGLFADEAQALLNTWELSYFKSTGLRVFFLVPRAWTDFYLPLDISPLADLSRVMVGRIELVTPDQRDGLQKIAQYPAAQIRNEAGLLQTNFYGKITFNFSNSRPSREAERRLSEEMAQVNAGQKSLASFVSVPQSYQTYLDLGRFRNALILDEARRRPALTNFISTYRLDAYKPAQAD